MSRSIIAVLATSALGLLCLGSSTALAQNPVPLITQPLVPASASPGGSAFTLTVCGAGFVSNSVVRWDGSPRVTTYASSSRLTAAIPASDINRSNTAWVTVSNPPPGGGVSGFAFFPIAARRDSMLLRKTDYYAPISSIQVVTADFNGDGRLDLASAHWGYGADSCVAVYLGNGDGTFQPCTTYYVWWGAHALSTGDFNSDGIVDLTVAARGSHRMLILLGNGDGTFKEGQSYDTPGAGPYSFCVGDFNSDSNLDVVSANEEGGSLSVFLGRGDGTFQSRVDYGIPNITAHVTGVATADFNRDGQLDLAAVCRFDHCVAVLLGNGDGTFQPSWLYPIEPGDNNYLIAADLNEDGRPDLAVANADGLVSILLGKADGSFDTVKSYATGGQSMSVAVADFNGDAFLDLVTANYKSNNISLLLGNTNSTFQSHMDFPATSSPRGVCVGDFDGDGRLDLAIGNQSTFAMSVLLQPGDTNPPVIIQQPLSRTLGTGQGTALSVQVTGERPFGYQWRLNGAAIAGATRSTLALPCCSYAQAGLYTVVITNVNGAVTSASASVALFDLEWALGAAQTFPLLALYGAVGTGYRLECSGNLATTNWTLLAPVTLNQNWFYYVDDPPTSHPQRFYRAVPQ